MSRLASRAHPCILTHMKLPTYSITAHLHPRSATGSIGSDTHIETVTVEARNRSAACSAARAKLEAAFSMPYGFALTFVKVTRNGDSRPWLTLSSGSSYRGASMGRVSLLPIGHGPIPFHLVKLRLDSGGYDAGGAYWGHGEPLYRAVSKDELPTAYRFAGNGDPTSTGQVEHVEHFTRAASRAEAKDLIRRSIPNATFLR